MSRLCSCFSESPRNTYNKLTSLDKRYGRVGCWIESQGAITVQGDVRRLSILHVHYFAFSVYGSEGPRKAVITSVSKELLYYIRIRSALNAAVMFMPSPRTKTPPGPSVKCPLCFVCGEAGLDAVMRCAV